MRINIILLLYASFLISSCETAKSRIQKELVQLKSLPIKIYDENFQMKINGKDTVVTDFMNSDTKLIVYFDSTSCTSCAISKMYVWNTFINYSREFNGKFKIYFIFHSCNERINELDIALKNTPIDYPVLIDENGEFEKLNPHLPKNKALHTFLLDENSNVILVGNPLNNKGIEKLFYKKTQELLAK